MTTNSDPQSSSLLPLSWVPDATEDSTSTLSTSISYTDWFSGSDSPTSSWTWIETDVPTAAGLTSAGPPSTPTFLFSTLSSSPTVLTAFPSSVSPSRLIETQTSQIDSTGQNAKGIAVKLRIGHIVAISFVTFGVLLAMAILLIYLIRVRPRKLGHQQLYSSPSSPDENFDDNSSTLLFLENTGRSGGGEAFEFGAAVGMRGRTSVREHIPSQELKSLHHNGRRSLSDGEACPILRPSLTQSDSVASASSTERETPSLGLNESPTIQSWSSVVIEEFHGRLSPPDPPRYSQIPRMQPIIRPPRPLPVPRNPRPLLPQRRVDTIQVRKQNKPPLISSSTISLPLLSPPPTLSSAPSSSLRNTSVDAIPILRNFPPLLPQRRAEHSTQVPPCTTPLAPLRPTPTVSLNPIPKTNISANQSTKNFQNYLSKGSYHSAKIVPI